MSSGSPSNVYNRRNIGSLLDNLELNGPIHEITATELNRLLKNIASEEQIESYLTSSGHFCAPFRRRGKRWTCIPSAPQHETDLYESYQQLFGHILNYFNVYNPDQRILANFFTKDADAHSDSDALKDVPVISAMAINEVHFLPWDAQQGYRLESCITPVEIKIKGGELTNDEERTYLAQCAAYVEKIWASQPGRRWVYVPIFTTSHVRLLQFDHGGVLRSSWIDINNHPDLLVRIILFTLSQSAVNLGAHPAFTSDKEDLFITVSGVKYKTLTLIYEVPKGISDVVMVWVASDEEGNQRVIKWSWTSDIGDPLETQTMGLLKGFDGVVQMVARQEDYYMFKGRPVVPDRSFDGYSMAEVLVVMEMYGKTINHFATPMQLVCALRDAVAGLQAMWEVGVVHRDISCRNILLGKPNAPVGSRGVIIDMDRAVIVAPGEKLPKVDPGLGTMAFRSWDVVNSERFLEHARVHHDYLQDLQSVTWVFLWIVVGTERVLSSRGKRVMHYHPFHDALESSNLSEATLVRRNAFCRPETVEIKPGYPHQFEVLKTRMLHFFAERILYNPRTPNRSTREELASRSKKDFAEFLALFDQAIEDMVDGVIRDINDYGDTEDEYSGCSDEEEEECSTEDDATDDEEIVEPTSVDSRVISDYGDTEDEHSVYSGDEGSTGDETEDEVFEEVVEPEIGDTELEEEYSACSDDEEEASTGDATDDEEVVEPEVVDIRYISHSRNMEDEYSGKTEGVEHEIVDGLSPVELEVAKILLHMFDQANEDLGNEGLTDQEDNVRVVAEEHAAVLEETTVAAQEAVRVLEARHDDTVDVITEVVAENPGPLMQNQANVRLKRARDVKEEVDEDDAVIISSVDKENMRPNKRGKRA